MKRIGTGMIAAVIATTGMASTAKADHYGYHHHGYGYRHHDRGGAIVGGIMGLAAGAIIAGALSQREEPRRVVRGYRGDADHVAYCARRYRSYDPYSNTFVGNDGRARQCR